MATVNVVTIAGYSRIYWLKRIALVSKVSGHLVLSATFIRWTVWTLSSGSATTTAP